MRGKITIGGPDRSRNTIAPYKNMQCQSYQKHICLFLRMPLLVSLTACYIKAQIHQSTKTELNTLEENVVSFEPHM
jgi:hypothetical protein